MPYNKTVGILTDIGTEELAHAEMIAAIVYQLTRCLLYTSHMGLGGRPEA